MWFLLQLLSEGADPNIPYGMWKKTCLHLAAERQNRLLLELLISKRADPMAVSINGQTVAHIILTNTKLTADEELSRKLGNDDKQDPTFEMIKCLVGKAPKLAIKKDYTMMAPVDIATATAERPDATLQQQEIAHFLQTRCGKPKFPGKQGGKNLSNVKALLTR